MTYGSSFSPDAARHNQIDQRLNGILDFDNRNDWNQGQAALNYGSGVGIEFDVAGANFLINGSKVGAPANSVQLSNGHATLYRTDHIYASEDGAYNVLEGSPDDNLYAYPEIDATTGTVEWAVGENEQAGGPAPKGQPFTRKRGELLFSILVPPGASSIDAFTQQHIADRRRTAIDLLNTGRPRVPSISSQSFGLYPQEWELWHLSTWAGHTLRLWDYSLSNMAYGLFNSSNFKFYLVDFGARTRDTIEYNGGDIDWSSLAVWESEKTRQRPSADGEPIVNIDLPSSGVDSHAFVVKNTVPESQNPESDEGAYLGRRRLFLSVTYTIERTDDL